MSNKSVEILKGTRSRYQTFGIKRNSLLQGEQNDQNPRHGS